MCRQKALGFKSSLRSLLTVDAELDLSASVAHRAGGGADVDSRVVCSGVGDVKVAVSPGLKVVPDYRLPPLQERQP